MICVKCKLSQSQEDEEKKRKYSLQFFYGVEKIEKTRKSTISTLHSNINVSKGLNACKCEPNECRQKMLANISDFNWMNSCNVYSWNVEILAFSPKNVGERVMSDNQVAYTQSNIPKKVLFKFDVTINHILKVLIRNEREKKSEIKGN